MVKIQASQDYISKVMTKKRKLDILQRPLLLNETEFKSYNLNTQQINFSSIRQRKY